MNIALKSLGSAALAAALLGGCASLNNTEKGGLLGGAAGAAIGAAWGAARGNAVEGALIGAGVGAAAGGTVGYIMDKQQAELKQAGILAQKQKDNSLLLSLNGNQLQFDTGRSSLSPDGQALIDKVGGILAKYPQDRILIEGFTDNVGSVADNQALSQERADAVKNAFLLDGVQPSSILSATGYGESNPVASNATAEGRAQNRRVVLRISVPQDQGGN